MTGATSGSTATPASCCARTSCRVRPDRGDPHRRARQGPRRRQGRAQDEVEVRRPARADESRALLLYRGRELDIVSQAESVEPLSPMLSSLDRASQGLAVIEAVDQLALEREPNPQLYRMSVGVLRTIADRAVAAERRRRSTGSCSPTRACARNSTRACAAASPNPTWRSWRSTSTRAACCAGPADRARRSVPRRSASCATSSAAASTRRSPLDASPATHEVSSLATKALEFHIERRLKPWRCSNPLTEPLDPRLRRIWATGSGAFPTQTRIDGRRRNGRAGWGAPLA